MSIRAHRNNAGYRRALSEQEINEILGLVDHEQDAGHDRVVSVSFMPETGARRAPYKRAA
jgi:hypothetical protein